jgi:hypothetical protein
MLEDLFDAGVTFTPGMKVRVVTEWWPGRAEYAVGTTHAVLSRGRSQLSGNPMYYIRGYGWVGAGFFELEVSDS